MFVILVIGSIDNVGDASSQMGTNLNPTLVGSGVLVQLMDGGDEHFCMLSMKGKIKCWGNNASGFHFYYIIRYIFTSFLKNSVNRSFGVRRHFGQRR